MTDQDCEQFQQVAAEFTLGVLPGFERAQALAHLDACPRCRWTVSQFMITRDRMLELVPEAEPPEGFEGRVLREAPRPVPPVRRWIPVVAGLLAVALAGGGWLLGRATAPQPVAPPSAVAGAAAPGGVPVEQVELRAEGRWVGQAFAYPGEPSFVYLSLDTRISDQSGPVTVSLERPDGSTVALGTFQMRKGYGSWGASAQLDGDALRTATLVVWDAAGRSVATARLSG